MGLAPAPRVPMAPAVTLQETGSKNTQHPKLYDLVLETGLGLVCGHFTPINRATTCATCRIPITKENGVRWAHGIRRPRIETALIDETPMCICCAKAMLNDANKALLGTESKIWKAIHLERQRSCATCKAVIPRNTTVAVLTCLINVNKKSAGRSFVSATEKEITFCDTCRLHNLAAWRDYLADFRHPSDCVHCTVRTATATARVGIRAHTSWPRQDCYPYAKTINGEAAFVQGWTHFPDHNSPETCPDGASAHRLGVCNAIRNQKASFTIATRPGQDVHVAVRMEDGGKHAGLDALRASLAQAASSALASGGAA
jgi:hypothetical protein